MNSVILKAKTSKLLSRFYVSILLKKINNRVCLGVVLYFDMYTILLKKTLMTEIELIHEN